MATTPIPDSRRKLARQCCPRTISRLCHWNKRWGRRTTHQILINILHPFPKEMRDQNRIRWGSSAPSKWQWEVRAVLQRTRWWNVIVERGMLKESGAKVKQRSICVSLPPTARHRAAAPTMSLTTATETLGNRDIPGSSRARSRWWHSVRKARGARGAALGLRVFQCHFTDVDTLRGLFLGSLPAYSYLIYGLDYIYLIDYDKHYIKPEILVFEYKIIQ